MVTPTEVRAAHERIRRHIAREEWDAVATTVARLAQHYSPDELNWGLFADLYWCACEVAADQLLSTDAPAAVLLYRLALVSYEKDASQATSGGEGMQRMLAVHRVRDKLAALPAG